MDAEPMTNEELDTMLSVPCRACAWRTGQDMPRAIAQAREANALRARLTATESIVAAARAYVDADAQVRGALYRELCAALAAEGGDMAYDELTWPRLYEKERARLAALEAEAAAVAHAARMPADYEHGLPAWVNYIYTTWQALLDRDGRPIRRSEDIEKMIADARRLAELEAERDEWKTKAQEIHGEDIALRERLANAEADKIALEAEVARLRTENAALEKKLASAQLNFAGLLILAYPDPMKIVPLSPETHRLLAARELAEHRITHTHGNPCEHCQSLEATYRALCEGKAGEQRANDVGCAAHEEGKGE